MTRKPPTGGGPGTNQYGVKGAARPKPEETAARAARFTKPAVSPAAEKWPVGRHVLILGQPGYPDDGAVFARVASVARTRVEVTTGRHGIGYKFTADGKPVAASQRCTRIVTREEALDVLQRAENASTNTRVYRQGEAIRAQLALLDSAARDELRQRLASTAEIALAGVRTEDRAERLALVAICDASVEYLNGGGTVEGLAERARTNATAGNPDDRAAWERVADRCTTLGY